MYELDINKTKKTLFEISFDNIKKVKEKYNAEPFWVIMTSKENHNQIINFFKEKNYFDYNKHKVLFFKQGQKPILDIKGKLVLENEYTIKQASNGNGDVFKSLQQSGILEKLKQNKIKYISFSGIDNILANPMDSSFIGIMENKKYQIGSKSIFKEHDLEKSAVFCNIDNRPNILGYNYITKELSNLKDEKGKYLYRDKNILAHIMTIEAVEKVAKIELRYNRAFKKNTYLDIESEKYVTENCFKFEKFIFDAFKYFEEMLVLRVKEEEEFAPIKNLENTKQAIELYLKKYKN